MFKTIYLKNLRNNEFIQFNQNILQIIEENNPNTPKVDEAYIPYKEEVENMDANHKKSLSSELTGELKGNDVGRDRSLRGIIGVLTAYKYHYDEKYRDAAELLLAPIELYEGDITRYSNQYETNAIDDIYSKWNKSEECKQALELLHLTDWAEELNLANTNFNTTFIKRVKENAENNYTKVLELRKNITDKYSNLMRVIGAFAIIDDAEVYNSLVSLINSLIDEYQKTIIARASRRGHSIENEEDTMMEEDSDTIEALTESEQ